MKNPFLVSAIPLLLCVFLLPSSVFASESTHATEVVSSNIRVLNPNAALGVPDEMRTSFLERDAEITLGFNGAEASGDVIIHYLLTQFGAGYTIELLDKNFQLITKGAYDLPVGQTEIIFPHEGTYSYIRIGTINDKNWALDAITVKKEASTEESTPDSEEILPSASASIPQGLLVKLPDDGDATTSADAAVYIIGGDGMRHAFPTEAVFSTWFSSYESVALIDPEHLAEYPLGKNVTIRPGTALVKLATDPKVYAVEPGGKLRWIASEAVANTLFGTNWAKRIVDVSDASFANYSIGEPIYTAVHPDGSIGVLSTGEVVYLENGLIFSLSGATADLLRINSDYFVPMFGELGKLYVDGGSLVLNPKIQFPY